MSQKQPKVSVIILSFNSKPYIEKCLETLLAQDYSNFEVKIVINGSEDGSAELIEEKYSKHKQIEVLYPEENLWFCKGNNYGIRNSDGDYVFALNQDTVLEKGFISELVKTMEENSELGSVSGKLLHYKYSIDSKTKIIDSTGIEIFKSRRVIDRGQWEVDRGQYDNDLEIFGASGAAAMYRREALEDIKMKKEDGEYEYFDENFLHTKEDIDLSWRLQLFGWKCRYVPKAVLYHGRTVGRSWPTQFIRFILNRRRQPRFIRQLAFKNHYLMLVKNETSDLFLRHLMYLLIREFLLVCYTVVFEPFQFLILNKLRKQLPKSWRKRKKIMARTDYSKDYLKKLFH